jgi:hypothetical protein
LGFSISKPVQSPLDAFSFFGGKRKPFSNTSVQQWQVLPETNKKCGANIYSKGDLNKDCPAGEFCLLSRPENQETAVEGRCVMKSCIINNDCKPKHNPDNGTYEESVCVKDSCNVNDERGRRLLGVCRRIKSLPSSECFPANSFAGSCGYPLCFKENVIGVEALRKCLEDHRLRGELPYCAEKSTTLPIFSVINACLTMPWYYPQDDNIVKKYNVCEWRSKSQRDSFRRDGQYL